MSDKAELIHNDGTLWRASYDDAGTAIASLFGGGNCFFFRQVEERRNPKWKFWKPRVYYVDTGIVWQGNDFRAAGFEVIEYLKPPHLTAPPDPL